MNMNRWAIAIALFAFWSDVAAAAIACRSSPGTDDYYQYRLIDGRKCWFRGHTRLEKSALAWKSETRRQLAVSVAMAAGEGMHQRPAVLRGPDEQNLRKSPRSEPAPDFDAVFAHFPAYEVARPPVHLLYPARVAQAYGAKRVAVVVYRREQ